MESIFLQAFQGKNKTVPVWFMRQAGRYLPAYRAIREKYSLDEMFTTPDLAAEITCLPIDALGVDAAILFADILTLPAAMGFDIKFSAQTGPVIANPIATSKDVGSIRDFEDIPHIRKAIAQTNEKLPRHIPLIGFAGAPFTVLCYLIEGGSSVQFKKTLKFLVQHESAYHKAMEILTRNTIAYLKLQQNAGIKAFQLFDTWAGILRPADFARLVLPYVRKIFDSVDLPSIYYLRNTQPLLGLAQQSGADFLSVCQSVVLGHSPVLEKDHLGVQGNLFNGLLYADNSVLEREINDILIGAQRHYSRYIFNLSHGIFPDVEADKLKFIAEKVHQFRW